MAQATHARYVTKKRREGGELKDRKCIICHSNAKMEHHPDHARPFLTKPVCSGRCHYLAKFRD